MCPNAEIKLSTRKIEFYLVTNEREEGRERVSQRRRLHALNYVSHQLPVAIFQNYNIVRQLPVSNIMYASRRVISVCRGRHRCLPQIDLNWKINAIPPG